MRQAYRRDIDGLRAFAVLGVMLYHYGATWLPGGYAGVDVFFVISGFLIGGIILDERADGQFSFRRFYIRRARRILPALYAMMLLTIPLAAMIMTPHELRYFGGAIFSTLLFLSNVWFYNLIDYFNPSASLDPLVHTWSLGVEEQFYFIAPLLLVFATRGGRSRVVLWIGALLALSFTLMLAVGPDRPSAAFYLIQFRAWELALGVLAAVAVRLRPGAIGSELPYGHSAVASVGVALVLGSFLLTPPGVLWPSVATLPPAVGAAMVLVGGTRAGPAVRFLSLRPFVAVGLISYSAYLYHQPVYSIAIIATRAEELALWLRAALFLLSLALAAASWWLVERPFRHGRLSGLSGRRLMIAGAALLLIFAVGGHITKGYPTRLPPEARRAIAFEDSLPPRYEDCAGGRLDGETLDPTDACVHGAAVEPQIAFWGDSHAATLAAPVGEALAGDGLAVREYTLGGCPPILDVKNVLQLTDSAVRKSEYCSLYVRRVLDTITKDETIRLVILFAYWNNYTERRDFDAGGGRVKPDKLFSVPVTGPAPADETARLAYMQARFDSLLEELAHAGKSVLIIYPMPEAPFSVPQTYAWALWKGGVSPAVIRYPTSVFEDYSRLARDLLDRAASTGRVDRLDLSNGLCSPAGDCRMVDEKGDVLFRDSNHLSLAGSARIVPAIADRVRAIMATLQPH